MPEFDTEGAPRSNGFRRVLAWLDRVNAAHPWSHNDFYHPWLLRRLPGRMSSALDVGAGTGTLARALAARADTVLGIDTDVAAVAEARALSATCPRVRFKVTDLRDVRGRTDRYDVVTAVAVVHHLPLAEALAVLAGVLAVGGRLLVVGCYRTTRADLPVELVAVPANLLFGLLRSPGPATGVRVRTAEPTTSLAEVRAVAARVLPGARVRRRLFWRYTLTYRRRPDGPNLSAGRGDPTVTAAGPVGSRDPGGLRSSSGGVGRGRRRA